MSGSFFFENFRFKNGSCLKLQKPLKLINNRYCIHFLHSGFAIKNAKLTQFSSFWSPWLYVVEAGLYEKMGFVCSRQHIAHAWQWFWKGMVDPFICRYHREICNDLSYLRTHPFLIWTLRVQNSEAGEKFLKGKMCILCSSNLSQILLNC